MITNHPPTYPDNYLSLSYSDPKKSDPKKPDQEPKSINSNAPKAKNFNSLESLELFRSDHFEEKNLFTKAFFSYRNLVSRVFTSLPQEGKLAEVAKRLTVSASPIIFPVLGTLMLIAKRLDHFTRSHVDKLAENILEQALLNIPKQNQGSTDPYKIQIAFKIKSQTSMIYAQTFILNLNQTNKLLDEIKNIEGLIKKDLTEHRFHAGESIEVTGDIFIEQEKNDHTNYAYINSKWACKKIFIPVYKNKT
jgi:hypothetical protein